MKSGTMYYRKPIDITSYVKDSMRKGIIIDCGYDTLSTGRGIIKVSIKIKIDNQDHIFFYSVFLNTEGDRQETYDCFNAILTKFYKDTGIYEKDGEVFYPEDLGEVMVAFDSEGKIERIYEENN